MQTSFLLRLQSEYNALITKVNEFAHAKKQWMTANKASVLEHYDLPALNAKVKELKANFIQQKKAWIMLNARLT